MKRLNSHRRRDAHGLLLLEAGMWCSSCRRPFVNPKTGLFYKYVGIANDGKPWRFMKGIAFCDRMCARRFADEIQHCLLAGL